MCVCMFEEHLIGCTEKIELFVRGIVEAVFGAAAPAGAEPGTLLAFLGEDSLLFAESGLLGGVQHIDQPFFHDVAQPPFGIDEEIT